MNDHITFHISIKQLYHHNVHIHIYMNDHMNVHKNVHISFCLLQLDIHINI